MILEGAIACFLANAALGFTDCRLWDVNEGHWLLRSPFHSQPSSKIAIKRVLARQLTREMRLKKITKTEMATKMQTSRAQLDRLLDPEKTGVSIDTIQRAASVVGLNCELS